MFYDKINEAKINQYKEAQQSGDTVTAENLLESLQKTVQKTPPKERKTADSERSRMKSEMKRKMMSEEKKKEFSSLANEIKDMEYNEGKAYVLKKYPRIDRVSLDNFLVWAYGGAEF